MVLGSIIGAAVACNVISKVSKAVVASAQNRQPKQQINCVINTNNYNTNYNSNNYINYNPQTERTYANCDFCGSIIELQKGVTRCSNCGAPLRINQKSQQNPRNTGTYYNGTCDQRQQPLFYSFPCYRCGAKVRYTKADIIRSPRGNKAVAAAGFRGYTGEVRCVRCGTLLPHFESNLDNGW